jgi:hypothetical protein
MSQQHQSQTHAVKLSVGPVEEIAAQVRAEYAKFIEKRDAIRKSAGKLRRSMLHTLLS